MKGDSLPLTAASAVLRFKSWAACLALSIKLKRAGVVDNARVEARLSAGFNICIKSAGFTHIFSELDLKQSSQTHATTKDLASMMDDLLVKSVVWW